MKYRCIPCMEKQELVECQACGSPKAFVVAEPRYHGFRGHCPECGGDWPES